ERAELIERNPARLAKKPRAAREAIETYTPEELASIIRIAPGFAAGGVIATLAGTGVRLGEVLALDVEDWNATAGTLSITKTYSRRFGLGPPKSHHSKRTVTVPDVLISILRAAAAGREPGEPLFPSHDGSRRSERRLREAWGRLTDAAGVTYKKLHALRH